MQHLGTLHAGETASFGHLFRMKNGFKFHMSRHRALKEAQHFAVIVMCSQFTTVQTCLCHCDVLSVYNRSNVLCCSLHVIQV